MYFMYMCICVVIIQLFRLPYLNKRIVEYAKKRQREGQETWLEKIQKQTLCQTRSGRNKAPCVGERRTLRACVQHASGGATEVN